MALPRVDIELLDIADDGSDELTFEGEAFTGIAVELGPAGQTLAEVCLRFGKYHGPQRVWDEAGRLREEEYFCVGVRHGATRAWDEQGRFTLDEIWEFYLRTHARLPGPDGELSERGWLAEDDPAMFGRWREHRASVALHPIIELVDDEFVEVPWPFDDLLPEGLRQRLVGGAQTGAGAKPGPSAPVVTVEAHTLDFPSPEAEVQLIEMILPITIENIPTGRDNLGAAFDGARRLLGFRWALDRPSSALVEALETIVELGVALFRRASVRPDETVSLKVGGRQLELPGAASYYNSAPRWADAVGAAMTLRDRVALDQLCSFDVASFGGSYDGYHDVYAEAVIAFETQAGDADALLCQAAAAAARAKSTPERGRRLGVPLVECARAVVAGDAAAFNHHLAEGLDWYRTIHSRARDKHEAALAVPLRYLGWAATAHGRGLDCRVRSAYLPSALVDGSFEVPR